MMALWFSLVNIFGMKFQCIYCLRPSFNSSINIIRSHGLHPLLVLFSHPSSFILDLSFSGCRWLRYLKRPEKVLSPHIKQPYADHFIMLLLSVFILFLKMDVRWSSFCSFVCSLFKFWFEVGGGRGILDPTGPGVLLFFLARPAGSHSFGSL